MLLFWVPCKPSALNLYSLRISQLHTVLNRSPNRKQLKRDAWVAKKFCVLIKRKLQRGQVPRVRAFRELMAAVFPNRFPEDWEVSLSKTQKEGGSTRV